MYTSSVVERPKCFGLAGSKLSSVVDLPFDDEFHAARLASKEVGAELVFGDRPIEIRRSKAVNGCKTMVGVIGNGHMNDVIYALVSDSGDIRFKNLVERRDSSDGGARA
ncbi:unnamed protein product [Cochlearia groenlandica]